MRNLQKTFFPVTFNTARTLPIARYRYKFSWSPRSALVGTMGWARYLKDGKEIEIAKGGALLENVRPIEFLPGFALEGYPNRDSTIYRETYGIQTASTVLRGTLRYKGFCNATKGLHMMGLFSDEPHPALHPTGPEITWVSLVWVRSGKP